MRRRDLLKLGAAGLLLPRMAHASASDRRFLFVTATGGWDPTRLFAPLFDHPVAAMEADASQGQRGDLVWVESPERPTVSAFFDRWADRTAFLNGFEVRSITHESCSRILMTGGLTPADDWPALLGAGRAPDLSLATLICSGAAYTSTLGAGVVRLGNEAQLPHLLDGSALARSDTPVTALDEDARDAVLDAVAARAARKESALAAQQIRALDQMRSLDPAILSPSLQLFPNCGGVFDELATAVEALASGTCMAASVEYRGWCGQTFDQHSDLPMQSTNFEELFQHLDWLLEELASTAGPAGGTLLDETTVVVLSEMGRHPAENAQGGKDHWTMTSAMLVGSGVAGGRVIGGYDDQMFGQPIDLASGEVDPGGTPLTARHLGATLLALGDVDPAEHTGVEAISALLA